MEHLDGEWTLIGGLMVQLLAERYGQRGLRPTDDVDFLASSRTRPSATERIAAKLQELGFRLAAPVGVDLKTAYRFTREDEVVDLLGPDGVGTPPKTVGDLETIEIKGGSQALARSECVLVRLDGRETRVRCPSLLGAILLKSRAIMSPHRDQDREDLVRLLLCVEDPVQMRDDLRKTERRWLVTAEKKLNLDDQGLTSLFTTEETQRARAAYQLLVDTP